MKNSYQNIITDDVPVLVDYFATWCGPCKTLAPILEEVKDDLGEAVKIIKIDIDKNQTLATKNGVRGVPTMILYVNGEQVWRQSGVMSKQDIIKIIENNSGDNK